MKQKLKIGRTNENDIVINKPTISRSHAIITNLNDGRFLIEDLDSLNGTFVNNQRIKKQQCTINDKIILGSEQISLNSLLSNNISNDSKVIFKIGRSEVNDIIIEDHSVSRVHATLRINSSTQFKITDDNSSNGITINGKKIDTSYFTKHDTIMIGNYKFNINEYIDLSQYTNQAQDQQREENQNNPEQIFYQFQEVKNVYQEYKKNRLNIQKSTMKKRMLIRVSGIALGAVLGAIMKGGIGAGLGGTMGTILGFAGSAQINDGEKLLDLTDHFKINYICPSCKSFLGNLPWENLNNQGKCPRCRTQWKK